MSEADYNTRVFNICKPWSGERGERFREFVREISTQATHNDGYATHGETLIGTDEGSPHPGAPPNGGPNNATAELVIKLHLVSTTVMAADMGTKALEKASHEMCRRYVMNLTDHETQRVTRLLHRLVRAIKA